MAEEQEDPFENPDVPCNNCGSTEWTKYEERTPSHLPQDSDIIKHYFVCDNCGEDGYIFEGDGTPKYTANLRK